MARWNRCIVSRQRDDQQQQPGVCNEAAWRRDIVHPSFGSIQLDNQVCSRKTATFSRGIR
eukprot:scaffold9760_cov117-Alexandrium_tamarense.AAC.14